MHETRWNKFVKVGLAVAALLAVVSGFGAFSYWMGNLTGQIRAESQRYQTDYAERTDQRVKRCFESATATRECVERAVTDNQAQQRAERDVQAQQEMAEWAFLMLIIAGASLGITGIGTVFLASQVILTRKAVEDTRETTQAMHIANDIARKGIEYQNRPRLVPSLHAEFTGKTPTNFTQPMPYGNNELRIAYFLIAQNFGQGVAKIQRFEAGKTLGTHANAANERDVMNNHSLVNVARNMQCESTHCEESISFFEANDYTRFVMGETLLLVHGHLEYRDLSLGDVYQYFFCFRCDLTTGTCNEYGGSIANWESKVLPKSEIAD